MVTKMDETCELIDLLCKYWVTDIIYWEASQDQIAGPSLSRLLLNRTISKLHTFMELCNSSPL
jgi:hypothetical protein